MHWDRLQPVNARLRAHFFSPSKGAVSRALLLEEQRQLLVELHGPRLLQLARVLRAAPTIQNPDQLAAGLVHYWPVVALLRQSPPLGHDLEAFGQADPLACHPAGLARQAAGLGPVLLGIESARQLAQSVRGRLARLGR